MANVSKIENQSKFEVTSNSFNAGAGGVMKITNNCFVNVALGLAGKNRETKVHSDIYTGNLFSGHDAKTIVREIGSRIGFEIISALPYNAKLSVGVHATLAHADTSITVNDTFQGAGAFTRAP